MMMNGVAAGVLCFVFILLFFLVHRVTSHFCGNVTRYW